MEKVILYEPNTLTWAIISIIGIGDDFFPRRAKIKIFNEKNKKLNQNKILEKIFFHC